MKRFVFGAELRDMAQHDPVHPDLEVMASGSRLFEHYNHLRYTSPEEAAAFGKQALLRTVWSPDYQLLDTALDDQAAIDDFSDDQTEQLLRRKHATILGYEAALQSQLPAIYGIYQQQLDTFSAQGLLPADVPGRFPAIAQQTEWFVSDDMNNILGRASPVHRHAAINSDIFTPHHSWRSTDTCVQQVVSHELTHRLAGAWSVEHGGDDIVYRTGLVLPHLTWLNEALTELISDSITSGSWRPVWPKNPNSTYLHERADLTKLLTVIPLEPLISYYFAENDDGASKRALHHVFRDRLGLSIHAFARATRTPESRADYLSKLP